MVTRFSRWRRHRAAGLIVVLLALGVTGSSYAAFAPDRQPDKADGRSTLIENGQKIYVLNCATCHGPNAGGTDNGPSLIGVGAAAVDFQLVTGRMPAKIPDAEQQPRLDHPVLSPAEIAAVIAWISSLGGGPAIPSPEQYDPSQGSPQEGRVLFNTNCAACHNFAAQGGALTKGKYALELMDLDPKIIAEAIRTGPGAMPEFPETILPAEQMRDIIAFLKNLEQEENPGGLGLGRLGPVAEGLFAWIVGIGILMAVAIWLAARTPKVSDE